MNEGPKSRGQRSCKSTAVELSRVNPSSLTALLLLKELTDVIRGHNLSERRGRCHLRTDRSHATHSSI